MSFVELGFRISTSDDQIGFHVLLLEKIGMREFIFFSVGQGEVLTKEIPKDDEEIRITNGWSKGMVEGKLSSQDKVGLVTPCIFTIVVGSILGHVELRANDHREDPLAKTVRTM